MPDVLGELWVPRPPTVGNRPDWPLGRYVIELRSASGGYVRYLGLELLDRIERASPCAVIRRGAAARRQRRGGSCETSNAPRAMTIAPAAAIHQP